MSYIKILIPVLFFLTASSFSQTNIRGAIKGVIKNIENNEPLMGANVTVHGTVLGATTIKGGIFVIQSVPFGKYNLVISLIGYRRKDIQVEINSGDTVHVVAELEPSAVLTAPVIVTASKREQSLREVPVSVSVVDELSISHRHPITIDNILKHVPGVNTTRSQINIRGSTGYSHGVGTRVLLLVDGLPMLSGDTDEIIWESIPTAQVERIEVVKGAGSALYGSSALGGVLNVITKSVPEKAETRIKFYGGIYSSPKYTTWQWTDASRNFSGIYASHNQRIDNLSFAVGGSRTLDDGYKRNDFWKRWNGWMRFGYDFSAYQSLVFTLSALDQRRGNFLYWKDLDHALEPKDDVLGQRVQSLRGNLNACYKHFVSDEFYYSFKVSWFRSKWEDNIPSTMYPLGSSSLSNSVVGELQSNYQLSARHMLTGGIVGSFNSVDAGTIFGIHHSHGGAFYIQDEFEILKSLRATFGGRFDFHKLEETKSFSQLNPKLGVAFYPFAFLSLRGSIGRGFRAPSVAEVFTNTDVGGLIIVPNRDLRPERSWSYEIGGSITPIDFLSIDLSMFRNEFWDLIEPTFGSDGFIRFLNITRAKITGTETALSLNFFDKQWINQFSYTFIYPRDISKNDILKYRPRHLLYVTSEANFNLVRLGVDFRYLSRIERIDEEFVLLDIVPDGDERVPIYITDVHLSADWNYLNIPIVVSFHINNMFQYYYVDLIGNLGPTRNYVLTLETKF